MQISFDNSLINETKLSPNEIYLLLCLTNKVKPLCINTHAEARKLRTKSFIDESGAVLPLGLEMVSKIQTTKKTLNVFGTTLDITDDYIDKYLSLFPKGKLPSGKQARADKKNLRTNFIWFFKSYNYTWDVVLAATTLYVNEYQSKNYMYMRTSQYFISKMNPDKTRDSELANYCAQFITGDYQEDSNHFSEKVV